jgi:hypothetical protein
MDAIGALSEVDAGCAKREMTEAERAVWSHAYWARLNHASAQFIPTQARQNANEVLAHAREFGVVEVMAAEMKAKKG